MDFNTPGWMKAVQISEPGQPDVLTLCEREVPSIGEDEVLIKVEAAGVNRPDVLQRQGLYPPPPGVTDIPGLEVAGNIVSLGKAVTNWKVGDAVCALLAGGGYAAYATASACLCLPLPRNLSMIEGAAIPETFFTVWTNVFERGRLKAGETLLVHGGSSGIGTTAIQMAVCLKARVFATAGNAQKCRACEALGAERCINYKTHDFVSILKELTQNRGVDVILDMVAGAYLPRNIALAAAEGRIVIIGTLGGATADINCLDLMLKRIVLTGSTLRARSVAEKSAIADQLRRKVWPLLDEGRIGPQIFRTFPLSDAAKAHRLMESGQHVGKIVLEI